MSSIRQERDADLIPTSEPTAYRTDVNRHEAPCSQCGNVLFVDDSIRDRIDRAAENELENPFICPECEAEYEDLAHGQ